VPSGDIGAALRMRCHTQQTFEIGCRIDISIRYPPDKVEPAYIFFTLIPACSSEKEWYNFFIHDSHPYELLVIFSNPTEQRSIFSSIKFKNK
jgi:hypothetical protein